MITQVVVALFQNTTKESVAGKQRERKNRVIIVKDDIMQRNILIGNGINIQFGGIDQYSNSAILHRMFGNMKEGKYLPILPDCAIEQQIGLFKTFRDILVDIEHQILSEEYLFLQIEVERVKKQYGISTTIEDIGMEDYFLALEYGFRPDDTEDFIHKAHRELQMPILDAIYNDGKINSIDYGNWFEKYLSSFDNVFTVNYDSNLDRYISGVNHLHGEFSKLAAEYDKYSEYVLKNPEKCRAMTMVPGFSHVYSNTIMSWYWLEKYGEWLGKESDYGADKFKSMTGKLDIVGMSPCNDEHLFIMINQSGITSVDYYYHSDDDRIRMQKKIKKPITYKNVEKLWQRLK